ncbi:hypothetical protein [Colwellia sp. MEBiC06753]
MPEENKEANVSNPVEQAVMWCFMPIKIIMFIVLLLLLPFYAGIDYGTSPNEEKRYTQFLIRGFKGLVRFLTT